MNILLVTPFFPPQTGGVGTYVEDLRRFLQQRGHQVYVLRTGNSDRITPCSQIKGGRVFEYYMRSFWVPEVPIKGLLACIVYFIPTMWRLMKFVREKEIDLVSLEYPLPHMFYVLLLKLWTKAKVVVGVHGDDVLSLHLLEKSEQWLVRQMIQRADWIVAHSSSLTSHTKKLIGSLDGKMSCIPYGVDCERLRRQAETAGKEVVRPAYILTVAKLYERKGLDTLLHTIQKLGPAANGYRFVIAGDGPLEQMLKQLAVDLHIERRVIFFGEVRSEDIPSLLQHCEFFVLPSRSEPFGIVLLEAMTFGKGIVATRVGGIPEFVVDGVNGLLVPPEDSD
ncbi:MAG: glycosyltransferase family 4 protein, partial [Nitrospiraceae bacterium]